MEFLFRLSLVLQEKSNLGQPPINILTQDKVCETTGTYGNYGKPVANYYLFEMATHRVKLGLPEHYDSPHSYVGRGKSVGASYEDKYKLIPN